MNAIRDAKRFEQLLELDTHTMPYAFDRIFSARTRSERARSKKKFQLLKRIDSQIRPMLRRGEKVYFVTSGLQSSILEQYFLGLISLLINRYAFIFTNDRILLLQINGRYKPLDFRGQILYQNIREIKAPPMMNTKFKFCDGKSAVFAKIPKHDRTYMRDLLMNFHAAANTIDGNDRGKENLCPHCYEIVRNFPDSCKRCGKPFKRARKASALSLLFPGFGDFYLGHHGMAAFEIGVMALIWLTILMPTEADAEIARGPVDIAIIAAVVVVIIHVPDALSTYYIGRKGIYPAKR